MAGITSYMKQVTLIAKIIGGPSMYYSMNKGEVLALINMDIFADGTTDCKPGQTSFVTIISF
jgi:threonine dehydratase